jgi:sodium transport system permease protein
LNAAWVVFRKELRETLRDRRTLTVMVAVPILLYPVLLIATEQFALLGMRRIESVVSNVAVSGPASEDVIEFLAADEDLDLVDVDDPVEAVRSDLVGAVAVFGPAPAGRSSQRATVLYDAADEGSQRARSVLADALRSWDDSLLARRLVEEGLPPNFVEPLALADSSVARAEELGGYTLGRFLPMLLIIMTLLGTFYPAIDMAAGEKERGTLETLLTAPVPPREIVVGKFLAVALIGVVAAALNLMSMLLTFQTGLFQFGGSLDIDFALPWASVLIIFATLIPLAVLFGSLFLGIALRSRSFKEAQTSLTPVYLLVLVPALLPVFPGITFTVALAAVPVAGLGIFFRELMSGSPALLPSIVAIATTGLWAWAALAFATASFGREDVLFGAGDGRVESGGGLLERLHRLLGPMSSTPNATQATGFIAAVAVLFFYLGFPLQAGWGERGLLVSEWMLLLVPALLFVRVAGFDVRSTFSLRRPRGRQIAGALLLIVGAMPLGWFLAWAQGFVLPVPWDMLEGLEDLITAESPSRLLWLVTLLALTPAICEEAVFRGVFLAGMRGGASPIRVALINGVVFGAFHISFESAFRFLPTAWLGFILAWAVLSTRSIWVGILMHFVNNGSIVVMSSIPALRAWLEAGGEAPPWVLLAPALLSAGVGVRLLAAGPHDQEIEPDHSETESDYKMTESKPDHPSTEPDGEVTVSVDPSR